MRGVGLLGKGMGRRTGMGKNQYSLSVHTLSIQQLYVQGGTVIKEGRECGGSHPDLIPEMGELPHTLRWGSYSYFIP